jgi:hypothetical protein
MIVLWVALAVPAVLALCWWDQLLTMALKSRLLRRDDDKAAGRRDANVR